MSKFFSKNIKNLFLISVFFYSYGSLAFISEILEAKKEVEGYVVALESIGDTLEDIGGLGSVEDEYTSYKRELDDIQKTINEYERLGVDIKDFAEIRNRNPNSIKGQIRFFKDYIKRASGLLKKLKSITQSPESITASEQIETNRTLRALLEDSQTRELRRLRKEIAGQKILLERRKKEQEFIDKQYAYINRHSKRKGFGVFHPFRNEKDADGQGKKRKKFLGIF